MYHFYHLYCLKMNSSTILVQSKQTSGKKQRVRQNLPAEPEAQGMVVGTWCSLSGLLEYIGSFWFSESVGYTCSLHLFVGWFRWKEFDKRVVEGEVEHAMEERGLRKLNYNFCFPDWLSLHTYGFSLRKRQIRCVT